MTDRFEDLLKELGLLVNLPLHVDRERACSLNINDAMEVQLKVDDSQERILVISLVCEIPAGRFREDVFKEALKANGLFPRPASVAYAGKINKLAVFDYISMISLTGEKLADYLGQFIGYADEWRVAIESGSPGPSISGGKSGLESPFGLRP